MRPAHPGAAIVRWWWLVAIGTVAGVVVGLQLLGVPGARYVGRANVVISPTPAYSTIASDVSTTSTLAQTRVTTYADLATGPPVLERVAASTSLTEQEVATQLSVAVPEGTTIIAVRFVDDDPETAVETARQVAEQAVDIVTEEERLPENLLSFLRARVAQPATTATPVAPVTPWRNVVLSTAAGLLAGLAAAVAVGSADRRVRLRATPESDLGAPVIGRVSRRRGEESPEVTVDSPVVKSLRAVLLVERDGRRTAPVVGFVSPSRSADVASLVRATSEALADAEASTLLFDADVLRPATVSTPDASESTENRDTTPSGRTWHGDVETMRDHLDAVVPRQAGYDAESRIQSPAVAEFLDSARDSYDVVLMVVPPADAGPVTSTLAARCDLVVVVVTPGRTRRRDLRDLARRLETVEVPVVAIVLSR